MFSRTEIILGSESIACLSESRVAVFGIGGVGGYVCEALIRTGLGHIDLIDHDTVSESNLNRQIIATTDTIGRNKVEIMRDRLLSINPEADVRIFPCFFLPENASDFHFEEYDYIVDAVDTVTAKLELITRADETGTPIISAMGAGNKLEPSAFHVADIYQTRVCPLARVMRRELKKRGITHLKVVYSDEAPASPLVDISETKGRTPVPGSLAYVVGTAGFLMASEVVKDITTGICKQHLHLLP
ncbi:MAG: tRNA threonylcarbamoyladenosine dehydratase [Eubacterium sp.]|nr:tRNA threonylcarbamoyladenosine dehydratase [Eubacterium sp.]